MSRYYADPEAACQLYHVCHRGRVYSQLCPNGSLWDTGHFTCRSWRSVDCSQVDIYRRHGYILVLETKAIRRFAKVSIVPTSTYRGVNVHLA